MDKDAVRSSDEPILKLSEDEWEFLSAYRRASPEVQEAIRVLIAALSGRVH